MVQDEPLEVGEATTGTVYAEPGMVQSEGFSVPARLYDRFLSGLKGSATDRRAVYLAGTYRSVGKG